MRIEIENEIIKNISNDINYSPILFEKNKKDFIGLVTSKLQVSENYRFCT
jgi:hypothetical protein